MRSSSSGTHDGLIRGALWLTVALAAGLAYFDANPILLESEERYVAGNVLALDSVSDMLVVIDYRAMQEVESFASLDFSVAWLNTLQQEVGPVAVADAEKMPDLVLSAYRFVVVTRSAATQQGRVGVGVFADVVEVGGQAPFESSPRRQLEIGGDPLAQLLGGEADGLDVEAPLVAKVVVEQAARHARSLGDVVDRDGLVAASTEELEPEREE